MENTLYHTQQSAEHGAHDIGHELSEKLLELKHGYDTLCSAGALGNTDFAAFASGHIYRIIRERLGHEDHIPIEFIEGVIREALGHMPFEHLQEPNGEHSDLDKNLIKDQKRKRTNEWTKFMAQYVTHSANNSMASV